MTDVPLPPRQDERRKSERVAVDFFVEVRRGAVITLHPAIDLSRHGLYLLATDDHGALDSEVTLDLDLTLPTGVQIHTQGFIAYSDDRLGQRGLGIEFTELSPVDQDAIGRFIDASLAARRRFG